MHLCKRMLAYVRINLGIYVRLLAFAPRLLARLLFFLLGLFVDFMQCFGGRLGHVQGCRMTRSLFGRNKDLHKVLSGKGRKEKSRHILTHLPTTPPLFIPASDLKNWLDDVELIQGSATR